MFDYFLGALSTLTIITMANIIEENAPQDFWQSFNLTTLF